jgi:uncharacterized membrane protein YozB (DUF420 family)
MTTLSAAPPRAAERRFYAGMAWAILVTVLLGFGRSYFLRPLFPALHATTPPERFFYLVHGTLFTAWIVLLVVQPALIATRRVALHRRLGWAGTGLAAAMVVAGIAGAILAARRPTGFMGIPVPPAQFLAVPLFDMALFALFVALAIVRRRDAQAHKRFMLIASINLLAAAIARIPLGLPPNPLIFFGGQDLFFVPLVIWDLKTGRRIHPATLWGLVVTLLSQPLRLMLSGTEAWASFAGWLLR